MLRPSASSLVRARLFAAATVIALALPLTACAPEPTDPQTAGAEVHGKNPIESGEAEHPEPPAEAYDKNVELPESFPAGFPRPDGLAIDDTGEREPGNWFIVFKAADQAEADAAWESVIESGGFTVSDSAETTEGGISATLSNQDLTVLAVTLPDQSTGTVLLNYDITALPGA